MEILYFTSTLVKFNMKHSIHIRFICGIVLLVLLGACQAPDTQQEQLPANAGALPVVDSLVPRNEPKGRPREPASAPTSPASRFILNLHGAILEASPNGKAIDTLPQNLMVAIIDSTGGWYRIDIDSREGWLKEEDIYQSPLPEGESLDNASDSLIFTQYFSEIGSWEEYQEPYFLEYTVTGTDLSLEKAYQVIKYFFTAEEREGMPRYIPDTEVRKQDDPISMELVLRPNLTQNSLEIFFNYPGGVTSGKISKSDGNTMISWSYSAD